MNKLMRLAVSAALFSLVAWQTDWNTVGVAFGNLRLEYWLGAVALLCLCQLASAWRWKTYADELQMKRTLPQLVGFYFIGMYFNLMLPTSVGGDVVRAWYLDGQTGQRLTAFASVFLDRLNGLVVLVGLACVAVTLSPLALPGWIPISVWCIAGCGSSAWPVWDCSHAWGGSAGAGWICLPPPFVCCACRASWR